MQRVTNSVSMAVWGRYEGPATHLGILPGLRAGTLHLLHARASHNQPPRLDNLATAYQLDGQYVTALGDVQQEHIAFLRWRDPVPYRCAIFTS